MPAGISLPRLKSPRPKPIRSRGPKALQHVLLPPPKHLSGPGDPPEWFNHLHGGIGPRTEWLVYWALLRLGKRPNVDFDYQTPMLGGRLNMGGAVVDFLMYDPPGIAINPVGLFWHYQRGSAKLTTDRLINEALAARGIKVIFIDEDDLNRDPLFYVKEALRGVDHSRLVKGFR